MKRFIHILALVSLALLDTCALRAQMPIDDAQLTGTANQVKTGATLTVQSGATLTVATGGTLTVPAAALPIAATSGLQAALDAKAATSTLGTAAFTASTAYDASGSAAAAQAYAIQRGYHTGTQAASTITGLGGAALLNVGTTAGTVAAGDDSRITGALSATTASTTYQPLDSDLTKLAANNFTATVNADTLYATGTIEGENGIFGAFNGNGADITFLNASNVATGTLADARLSTNVPLISAANTFTGASQTAPAWLLPTFSASTIATNQSGMGWDENGRVTIQTPVGALQFYTTGSPAVPVIYWPGKIMSDSTESNITLTSISANMINAPTGSEAINVGIIARSLTAPMEQWVGLQDYAGANGIAYANTAPLGAAEPVAGVYFPETVVVDEVGSANYYMGRYRTATQVKADLAITTSDVSGLGSAATTASSAYDAAGAASTAQAAAIAASQPRVAARVITTSDSLLTSDTVIVCTGAGGITLTLPAANAATPRPIQLEIINRTSGTVTLTRAGSDLFEGQTTARISAGASWSITSNASANWYLY